MKKSPRLVVSDTGPLITLEKITDGYGFIRKLFDVILVPPAVINELAEKYDSPEDYLRAYQISDLIRVQSTKTIVIQRNLNSGEAEAISLAFNLNLSLLLEEAAGRKVAHSLGVPFFGIARQVANAYEQRLISLKEAHAKLEELLQLNRINQKVFDLLWAKIG